MNILKETTLATKGEWTVLGRLLSYRLPNGQKRHVDLIFVKDERFKPNDVGTGWTVAELATLHNKLVEWARLIGEEIQ